MAPLWAPMRTRRRRRDRTSRRATGCVLPSFHVFERRRRRPARLRGSAHPVKTDARRYPPRCRTFPGTRRDAVPPMRLPGLLAAILLLFVAGASFAWDTEEVTPERVRANFARPIVLGPDDVRAFPDAPAGFRDVRAGAAQGRVETFGYGSGVTGTRRHANVYLPAGFRGDRTYPVLYLLHGIGGNQDEWPGYVRAQAILDNLIADGSAVPMIVVMPNGRALPDDRSPPPERVFTPENAAGFARFEHDLLDFLIPAIEAKYPVHADRAHRAIAGLSMGGGQALNFGFGHPDMFGWVGAFSAAPNTLPPAELVPDPAALRGRFALLYLSCGNRDGLINVSQDLHAYLKRHDIVHLWNVGDHGHDGDSWANNLHHFVQRIFH
ncbi:alpha/beta hydrolase [Marilutibacter chinensis]|uniref:Esterase family protein n=1 Tax=Marilutibacter chinensis TaxID=2912247 RepID=A0ABS9HQ81_9GAMM|nr:alpha/beta hydrolase-fold protein [Lysobacter chinensis]MCF7220384.1 hypothetical protein [Lysobacter chinensis]